MVRRQKRTCKQLIQAMLKMLELRCVLKAQRGKTPALMGRSGKLSQRRRGNAPETQSTASRISPPGRQGRTQGPCNVQASKLALLVSLLSPLLIGLHLPGHMGRNKPQSKKRPWLGFKIKCSEALLSKPHSLFV